MAEYLNSWSEGYQDQQNWGANDRLGHQVHQPVFDQSYGNYDPNRGGYAPNTQTGQHSAHLNNSLLEDDGYEYEDDWDDDWDDSDFYSNGSSTVKMLGVVAGLAVLSLLGFYFLWLSPRLDPSGDPGEVVAVSVPSGSSTQAISAQLEENGIIPSSSVFNYYIRARGVDANFRSGTYTLKENMSVAEAIEVLQTGPSETPTTNLVEGLWVTEIIAELDKQLPNISAADLETALTTGVERPQYLPEDVICEGIQCWEGLLFPANYEFSDDATAEEIVTELNSEFNRVADEVGLNDPNKRQGYTAYQIITIASLIESEAALEEDRPKIAEVIFHRLGGSEPDNAWLGIDATVIYSYGQRNPGTDVISIRQDNPDDLYNTSGAGGSATKGRLPPTPISAPGRSSLSK